MSRSESYTGFKMAVFTYQQPGSAEHGVSHDWHFWGDTSVVLSLHFSLEVTISLNVLLRPKTCDRCIRLRVSGLNSCLTSRVGLSLCQSTLVVCYIDLCPQTNCLMSVD